MEFRELTRKNSMSRLTSELDKLQKQLQNARQADRVQREMEGYKRLYDKFISGEGEDKGIAWDKIERLPERSVIDYEDLPSPTTSGDVSELLKRLVVVKLNGGLGTTMGCKGPKSTIPIRDDLTFLDLAVQQIEYLNRKYDADVPLVLMNSFNTEDDTQKVIKKYSGLNIRILTFSQSRYPRIKRESLLPLSTSVEGDPAE